jgi:hypothetical protein
MLDRTTRSRTPLWDEVRLLLQVALAIFVITVVIGILNGIDVFEPGHDTLITHVHAGTLGWITLAVSAAALWMFSNQDMSDAEITAGRRAGTAVLVTIPIYVAAFWVGTGVLDGGLQRPIAGTLVLIAVIWLAVWMVGMARRAPLTIPRLGLLLAWVSLVVGAVFGVLLGIYTSQGEVPGLSDDVASNVSGSHPPTMVVGYLILAGVAIVEWLLRSEDRTVAGDRAGVVQMAFIFTAGVLLLLGIMLDVEPLLIANGPLELIGLGIFLWRLRHELKPSRWSLDEGLALRMSVVGLIAGLGVLMYIIQGVASGTYETDDDIPMHIIIALDHLNFLGLMTNVLFGFVLAATAMGNRILDRTVVLGLNGGLAFFTIGLLAESSVFKRIGTPVMGVAILLGIVEYIRRLRSPETSGVGGVTGSRPGD